jgi:hypothetical protein
MPILSPTEIVGRVEALLVNPDREAGLASAPVERVRLTFAGIEGDAHGGLVRSSCSRVTAQYPRGTRIRNTRQLSVVSAEEVAAIAEAMRLPGRLDPAWIGASVVFSGIPMLTRLPPSSRLVFEGGASIVVDMENAPCRFPGEEIDRHHPGFGRFFVKSAKGRRGVTAWVEREGEVGVGEAARVHVPPQIPYAPLQGLA